MRQGDAALLGCIVGMSIGLGGVVGLGIGQIQRKEIELEGLRCELKELETSQEIKEENVLGNQTPEKFYEIDGKRVYLEIDGKPVEEYVKGEQ